MRLVPPPTFKTSRGPCPGQVGSSPPLTEVPTRLRILPKADSDAFIQRTPLELLKSNVKAFQHTGSTGILLERMAKFNIKTHKVKHLTKNPTGFLP